MQLAVLCRGGFDLFLRYVLRQVPVSSTRWFGDDGLQACVAWGVAPADVLSTFARSRCKQQVVFAVFKTLCGDGVCMCSFPLLLFHNFQAPVDDELQCIFLRHCVSSCLSLVLPIIVLDMNQI
jgi:hypothetical protein